MHKRAQVVAGDVKTDIAAIVTAHNLTKAQRQAKVKSAIMELASFQEEMQKETTQLVSEQNVTDAQLEAKKELLEKELTEKKAELEKDEKKNSAVQTEKGIGGKTVGIG